MPSPIHLKKLISDIGLDSQSPPFSPAALHGSLLLLVEVHPWDPSWKKIGLVENTSQKSEPHSTRWFHTYLEVPNEGRNPTVRLIVMFLVGQFHKLREKRYRVPRCKQGQQVRRQKLGHLSPKAHEKYSNILWRPRGNSLLREGRCKQNETPVGHWITRHHSRLPSTLTNEF